MRWPSLLPRERLGAGTGTSELPQRRLEDRKGLKGLTSVLALGGKRPETSPWEGGPSLLFLPHIQNGGQTTLYTRDSGHRMVAHW